MREKNNILNILRVERILLTGCNYVSHFFKKNPFCRLSDRQCKNTSDRRRRYTSRSNLRFTRNKTMEVSLQQCFVTSDDCRSFASGFEVLQSVRNWPLKHHNILFRTLAHIAIKVSHYQTIDCHRITLVDSNRVHTVDSQVNHPADSICDSDWLTFW